MLAIACEPTTLNEEDDTVEMHNVEIRTKYFNLHNNPPLMERNSTVYVYPEKTTFEFDSINFPEANGDRYYVFKHNANKTVVAQTAMGIIHNVSVKKGDLILIKYPTFPLYQFIENCSDTAFHFHLYHVGVLSDDRVIIDTLQAECATDNNNNTLHSFQLDK